MFPVPVDGDLTPKWAVGHIDRHRAGLVALGRLVDFPGFALGQAQIFSTTWRDRDRVPIFTIFKISAINLVLPICHSLLSKYNCFCAIFPGSMSVEGYRFTRLNNQREAAIPTKWAAMVLVFACTTNKSKGCTNRLRSIVPKPKAPCG